MLSMRDSLQIHLNGSVKSKRIKNVMKTRKLEKQPQPIK